MKILLLGKNGQVGWELQRSLSPLGEIIALDRSSREFCGDLSNPDGIKQTVKKIMPDVIVNAAAYTAVDKAEIKSEIAELINTTSVKTLACAAKEIEALLVHYSTDYVFDGVGTLPWKEDDKTKPLNIYGKSKRSGENEIINNMSDYLIFRTSWVYSLKGNNFIKTIIRLSQEKEVISVVDDQIGAPTGAELIADCTAHAIKMTLADRSKTGIYHLTASGATTWHEYACLIADFMKSKNALLKISKINPTKTATLNQAAQRPINSRLDTSKFRKNFGLNLPSWKDGVLRVLDEMFV
ncbi:MULTISPECIES: dTDP-4-dehydrorhamnose reductase [Pantoea]|uniref:dTDP-4-dehydrorhamnose reductase n=1 Tax=Pantoea TaxID=53335 RepID=UPI000CF5242D|nr:dTDP-4-dehydrorhamnose reductase [Pantoea ananatis]PQK74119.1 dTDP-4-dehydrorhamnose reductase [Pantoea ananatis]PQK79907.1 dTDP-4-dehydrorhamnose reductase [Pantoea ananatis]